MPNQYKTTQNHIKALMEKGKKEIMVSVGMNNHLLGAIAEPVLNDKNIFIDYEHVNVNCAVFTNTFNILEFIYKSLCSNPSKGCTETQIQDKLTEILQGVLK